MDHDIAGRDVADAAARNSLSDLVLLAVARGRDAGDTGESRRSARLAEINAALLAIISSNRFAAPPEQRGATGLHGFIDDSVARALGGPCDDLAYLFRLPDAVELAPAVEAAAEALLAQGPLGRDVLRSKALSASPVMRARIATVLERSGDLEAARRLRG